MNKLTSILFFFSFLLSVSCNATDELAEKVASSVIRLRYETPQKFTLDQRSVSFEHHRMGFALLGFVECLPKKLGAFLANDSYLLIIPQVYQVEALKLALVNTEYDCVFHLLTKFGWLRDKFFQGQEVSLVADYIRKNQTEWKRYKDVVLGSYELSQDDSKSEDGESNKEIVLRMSFAQAVKTLSSAMKYSSSYKNKYFQEQKAKEHNVFMLDEIDFLQEFLLEYFSLSINEQDAGGLFLSAFLAGNREYAYRIIARKPSVCFYMSYNFLIHDVIAKKSYSSESYQDVDKGVNAEDVCFLIGNAIQKLNDDLTAARTNRRVDELNYYKRAFCETIEMAVLDAAQNGRDDILRYIMNLPEGYAPDFSKGRNLIPDSAVDFATYSGNEKALDYLLEVFLNQLPFKIVEKFAGRAFVLAVLNCKKTVVSYLLAQRRVMLYREYFDSGVLIFDGNDGEMKKILEAAKSVDRLSLGYQPENISMLFQLAKRSEPE